MRDAAGDSGEFYTPRPVIRFIVQQVDPRLGEVVLDPAAGTGGFLAEALEHMRPRVQTVQQWRELQTNIRGIEKKPLPYLLATMNLLLHEVEQPNLRRENALAAPLSQIGASARVEAPASQAGARSPAGGAGHGSGTVLAQRPVDAKTNETTQLGLLLEEWTWPGGW